MPELERPAGGRDAAGGPARGPAAGHDVIKAPDGEVPRQTGRPRIVGFLCDFAVDASALTAPDGTMRDAPNVTLIKVPCSGFVRPAWLEFALRNGAEGTFVCGCPLGDCFNRLGNNLIGDRVVQLRRRFERQKIHPDRIAAIYFGLHDQQGFVGAVKAFSDRVAQLPGPVVPPPRAAAAARPVGGPAAGHHEIEAGQAAARPGAPGQAAPADLPPAAMKSKPAPETQEEP